MSLEKRYIRDGKRRIISSVTSGFSDESSVVRDEHGGLVSTNTADAGLLINRNK